MASRDMPTPPNTRRDVRGAGLFGAGELALGQLEGHGEEAYHREWIRGVGDQLDVHGLLVDSGIFAEDCGDHELIEPRTGGVTFDLLHKFLGQCPDSCRRRLLRFIAHAATLPPLRRLPQFDISLNKLPL